MATWIHYKTKVKENKMLEELLEGLLKSREQEAEFEKMKEEAGVPQVEQAIEELTARYPNTTGARRFIREQLSDIPREVGAACGIAELFEPSQQLVLLDYIAIGLKLCLIQIEKKKNDVLELGKEPPSTHEKA